MATKVKEKIQADMKGALKSGDSFRVGVLRMASSSFHNKEIEKRTKLFKGGGLGAEELEEKSRLDEEETAEVLTSEVKKRREAILEYERGGRQDLAQKEKAELEILKQYLPEEFSDEELRKIVGETIKELGAQDQKDFGRVMSGLMPKVKGRADGARVSGLVREFLSASRG